MDSCRAVFKATPNKFPVSRPPPASCFLSPPQIPLPSATMLVNLSIFDSSSASTVLPWTIHELGDDRLSLRQFFQSVSPADHYSLKEARVGKSKNSLDPVSNLGMVASQFCYIAS